MATDSSAANALNSGNAQIRGKIHTGPGGVPDVRTAYVEDYVTRRLASAAR